MATKTKAPVKQLMRGISKTGGATKLMNQTENIWSAEDVDIYLNKLSKDGYELMESFLVFSADRAYYVHYVLKLRTA